jgi:hypothetical protein
MCTDVQRDGGHIMTIKQVIQALGDWSIRLRETTPRHVLDQLDYLGHVAVLPGRLDPSMLSDNILASARYVGVYRGRDAADEYNLTGAGMAFWLGDEDDKGDIFETGVELVADTFVDVVTALLPAGGAIVAGTLHAQPGTLTQTFRWTTPRKAIGSVTELFEAEWRVNNDGTLDAGTVAQLYVTTPKVMLVRKESGGRELARVAIPGRMRLETDVEDYSTRVVVLAEGEGDAIATGDADALAVPYKDIHGNTAKLTRLVSSAETPAANADALAQLQLNRFTNPRAAASLDADAYDISGDMTVGDYLAVYDPDNGFYDLNNSAYWGGREINPIHLRCTELSWPVPAGWTVAFRRANGTWLDLSEHYAAETGQTTIKVGEFNRSLTAVGTQPVGTRPNGDSSVPAAPAFTGFSVGTYQSEGPGDGPVTSAAIRAQWSTPLNLDGSVVLDGDRYELRYRVNAVIGYQVTHGEMELFDHGDFGTHGAMLSEPVEASPQWMSALAGWGTNEFTIMELTPGVQYEIQIRGIDAATPPNFGPWSASSFVTTLGDLVAPPIPAAPVVAGNRISIQVVHDLGTAAAGILPPDLDHLEVHVGGAAGFTPGSDTYVGRLIATGGMAYGGIPAVGTFAIEPVDQVHVKVVAVDRSGNRSGASESATVTAELIDDAHISDLTVSKVTAGTISAVWLNAGAITTALSGRRIAMESDRLSIYGWNGGRVADLNGLLRRLSFYEAVDPGEDDMFSNAVVELGRTSEGTYGLRVADLFGETKVRVGQIDPAGGTGSENYGIALENPSGQLVKLEDFIFGPISNGVNTAQSTSSLSYVDLATVGPSVTVTIGQTGRAMLILSARIGWSVADDQAGGAMGVELTGANVATPGGSGEPGLSKYSEVSTGGAVARADFDYSSFVHFYEGLTPGETTFTCKYKSLVSGASADFQERKIAILPY